MSRKNPEEHNGPPMDLVAVDELISLHLRHRLSLAWDIPIQPLIPRASFEGSAHQAVSELLRLAWLGAYAESLARRERPSLSVLMIVEDAQRQWRERGLVSR